MKNLLAVLVSGTLLASSAFGGLTLTTTGVSSTALGDGLRDLVSANPFLFERGDVGPGRTVSDFPMLTVPVDLDGDDTPDLSVELEVVSADTISDFFPLTLDQGHAVQFEAIFAEAGDLDVLEFLNDSGEWEEILNNQPNNGFDPLTDNALITTDMDGAELALRYRDVTVPSTTVFENFGAEVGPVMLYRAVDPADVAALGLEDLFYAVYDDRFADLDNHDDLTTLISVMAVPEPSAFVAAIALGFIGLTVVRRRRRA